MARGGKGSRRGGRFGYSNPLGQGLNDLFSWNTLSSGITQSEKSIQRIREEYQAIHAIAKDIAAKREIAKLGILGVDMSSRKFARSAAGQKSKVVIDAAVTDVANSIQGVAATLTSPLIKQAVDKIHQDFLQAAASAKTLAEKQKALATADKELKRVSRMATGADALPMAGLSRATTQKTDALNRNIAALTKLTLAQKLGRRIGSLGSAIVGGMRLLVPLTRALNVGVQVFRAVNDRFNQFARMQMQVSAERGGYGRQIRGAGINFGHMTAALGAGRSAGMDDKAVVSQMVGLQGNIARARWGEGPLIDNMGKWGLTPFDANGNMKSNHQVMIDFSRALKAITDPMEKLQFLEMQGFRPEQMEYVANYEKFAKRQDYLKAHPEMRGTLEKADYLDESGFSAKADAATKIELRRREVLNQNAIEKGIIPGLIRSLDPENWLFSDWTARKQGVASAKSEQAMEKLTEELKNLSDVVTKEGGKIGVGSFSSKETNLSAKDLKALSLSSGWAEASKSNFGDQSAVHILRNVVGARSSGVSSETQKNINRGVGAVPGAIVGAGIGYVAGAILGGIATAFSGGAAAPSIPILMKSLGAAGGAVGGALAGGKVMEDTKGFWDFSNDDVEEAKEAAEGSDEDWEEWKKKTGLTNLKKSQVLDVDFDKESLEGAKVQSLVAKASELAGGKEVNIEALAGDKYLGRMTEGMNKSSKEYEDRVVEALARTADETIGKAEAILQTLKKGISVEDPSVKKRIEELAKQNESNGMGSDAARVAAATQATKEAGIQAQKEANLIQAQIEENQKQADQGYKQYIKENESDEEFEEIAERLRGQFAETQSRIAKEQGKHSLTRTMSFSDWVQKQADNKKSSLWADANALLRLNNKEGREFDKTTGKTTVTGHTMTRAEWEEKNGFGASQLDKEKRAYNQIFGEGGSLQGTPALWDSLTANLKGIRLQQYLAGKDFGGSKTKGYSQELAGMDDDTLVAKLALAQGTSEDEIRNNILTKDRYNELLNKKANKVSLDTRDQTLMRIYESSKAFKAESEKKKEEKRKVDEGEEDLATQLEAGRLLGADKKGKVDKEYARYYNMQVKASEKGIGLTKIEQARIEQLRKQASEAAASGGVVTGLTADEAAELEGLEKKETAKNTKVNRKKLIHQVAVRGGDLTKNFSKEEIDAYKQAQAEEKERFMQGRRSSEGKYKLYKNIEARILKGEDVDKADREFYDQEHKRLEKRKTIKPRKKQSLHDEPLYSKEDRANFKDTFSNALRANQEKFKNSKRRPLAETSDLRKMYDLKKKGMSNKALRERFPGRWEAFQKAMSNGSIEDMVKGTVFAKGSKDGGKQGATYTARQYRKDMGLSMEQVEKNFRDMAETNFKQREGESDEEYKARIDKQVNSSMTNQYGENWKKKMERAKAQRGAKEGEGDALAAIQKNAEAANVSAENAAKVEQAEKAAASADNGNAQTIDNSVHTENSNNNVSVTVNQNNVSSGDTAEAQMQAATAAFNAVAKQFCFAAVDTATNKSGQ